MKLLIAIAASVLLALVSQTFGAAAKDQAAANAKRAATIAAKKVAAERKMSVAAVTAVLPAAPSQPASLSVTPPLTYWLTAKAQLPRTIAVTGDADTTADLVDSDADGALDCEERAFGTDPSLPDKMYGAVAVAGHNIIKLPLVIEAGEGAARFFGLDFRNAGTAKISVEVGNGQNWSAAEPTELQGTTGLGYFPIKDAAELEQVLTGKHPSVPAGHFQVFNANKVGTPRGLIRLRMTFEK